MSVRFFADQCVPLEITESLISAGHDVRLLRDELPIRSLDPAVIACAVRLGRILLSLNGDFSDIVTYPPANFHGIIAIQLHNHPEVIPSLMERLNRFLASKAADFYKGKLLIVEPHRVRIRQ